MAQRALIDGTIYKINGGKTLANGVAHTIKNGKVKIDGTVYDISVSTLPRITVKGSPLIALGAGAYVDINGASVTGVLDQIFYVPIGETIVCHLNVCPGYTGQVIINGEQVANYLGGSGFFNYASYEYRYTVSRNASIQVVSEGSSSDLTLRGKIIIDEK